MGRVLSFILALLTAPIVLISADWNILNQKGKQSKHGVEINLKNYCESWRMNVELHNIRNFKVVPEECTDYIGKYMNPVQYRVDSERAIDECTMFLSTSCSLKRDGREAWIFDVDDTLLSTVPYFKKHHSGDSSDEYKEVQQYKADRRKQLIDQGYHIWGIVGDQWSSIVGLPGAKRTFKLPNPTYYVS